MKSEIIIELIETMLNADRLDTLDLMFETYFF